MREKRTTVADLANELGVSLCTINKALNGKPGIGEPLRVRVLRLARERNYTVNRVARVMARKPLRIAVVPAAGHRETRLRFQRGMDDAFAALRDCNVHKLDWDGGELWADSPPDAAVLVHRTLDAEQERRLADAGIPFVYLGTDAAGSRRLGCVRSDAARVGRLAAELIAAGLPPGAEVAILTGSAAYCDHAEKVESCRDELRRRGLSVVAVAEHRDNPAAIPPLWRELRGRFPNLRGLYSGTGVSGGIFDACEGLRTVATDLTEESRTALAARKIAAAVNQNCERAGETAIRLLYRFLNDREPFPDRLAIPPEAVLQNSL